MYSKTRSILTTIAGYVGVVTIVFSTAFVCSGQSAAPSSLVGEPTPHVRLKAQTKTTDKKDAAGKSSADETAAAEVDNASDDKPKEKKPKGEKRGTLIFAPIPIISPTFGSGLIVGLGYIFQLQKSDKKSASSTLGMAIPITSNGSRGVLIAGQLNFAENKYKSTFALGRGRANIEFFGIGRVPGREPISVDIKGSASFFFGEILRNVGKDIFIGPRYQYRKIAANIGGMPPPGGFEIPSIDLTSTTTAIGFHIQRDKRDSSFYPTKGSFWDLKGDFFAKPLGSARTYQTYKGAYNGYKTIGDRQVLAYRGMACSASDNTPFYDLCLFGGSDLRGYTTGQFQNYRMFATQAEYRRELKWRMGVVGFAGVGAVARNWGDFRFDELLPAAGVGFRFKLDKKNKINYRVDVGYGRVGPTLSMSVTEAF